MVKTIGIGKQDFASVIEDNCFFVDKTSFIKEWWDSKDDVTLITRPRRLTAFFRISIRIGAICLIHCLYGRMRTIEKFRVLIL